MKYSLKCAITALSIVLSATLTIVAMLSNVEVAWCKRDAQMSPMTLRLLVDNNDTYGVSVYWLLQACVLIGFARLINYVIFSVRIQTWRFLTTLDIAEGIMIAGMVMIAIIVTVIRVLEDEQCLFRDGASPFIGLLVASSGISISVSLFDIIMLVVGDAHSYEPVLDTQQSDDKGAALENGVGSCPEGLAPARLEIESADSALDVDT